VRGDVEVDQLVAGNVWEKYGGLPIIAIVAQLELHERVRKLNALVFTN